MCTWPPLFHHFPLVSFIISRAFSHLLLFPSAPMGSAIFLFSCGPFVCRVDCSNPTHNAGSSLSLGSATFGLRKMTPHLCSCGGLPTRRVTFGVRCCLPAVSFVQQLFGAQRSTVFSTLLTQCYKTALACKKPDGWSREMGGGLYVTLKTQNSSRFGRYSILYSKQNP